MFVGFETIVTIAISVINHSETNLTIVNHSFGTIVALETTVTIVYLC